MPFNDVIANEPTRTLLTVREVADGFAISPETVWNAVARGDFPPPLKVGIRLRRWDAHKLQEWINEGCPKVETPNPKGENDA